MKTEFFQSQKEKKRSMTKRKKSMTENKLFSVHIQTFFSDLEFSQWETRGRVYSAEN